MTQYYRYGLFLFILGIVNIVTSCGSNRVIPAIELLGENPTMITVTPAIELLGENPAVIVVGSNYIDEGAVASNNATIDTSGDVNSSKVGIYTITYSITINEDKRVTKSRTVYVKWSPLLIKEFMIDSRATTVDHAFNRILFTLEDGFSDKRDYTATLSWDGNGTIKIDNSSVTNGGAYTFPDITYGSKAIMQHYNIENILLSEYTIIFTNLPVVEITSAVPIKEEPKVDATFRLSDSSGDISSIYIGIEIRGGTSKQLPKKSYALELRENDNCKSGKNIKLLTLRKDDDWILDAAYRDTTFARDIMGHDTFNLMHKYAYRIDGNEFGQAAIKGELIEVILNGKYNGIYILKERVDRKLLDLTAIDAKKSGCNKDWSSVDWTDPRNGSVIYKCVNHDSNFLNTCAYDYYGYCKKGENKQYLWQGFEQKYPKLSEYDRREPLVNFVNFVINSSDIEFMEEIGDRVDIDNYVDYFISMMIGGTSDAITKNQYVSRNKSGKFFFTPWDWDSSFGMFWNGGKNNNWNQWNISGNGLIDRLHKILETGFNKRLKKRWSSLRGSILSNQVLKDRFKEYIDDEDRAFASQRTFERWIDSGNIGKKDRDLLRSTTYLNEWIDNRMSFIDDKINEITLVDNVVPNADAGVDQRVRPGTEVILDATASIDIDENDTITQYQWSQTAGTSVTLTDSDMNISTFTAPNTVEQVTLTFKVRVTDSGGLSAVSYVNITILPFPRVIINEIHYNPKNGTEYEFIELYNDEDKNISLSEWSFTDGIEYTFADIGIGAKETLVLAKDSSHYSSSIEWHDGKLSNKGELLTLRNSEGDIVDSVEYDDKDPWSEDADGGGPSLELKTNKRNSTDNDRAENWIGSSVDGGTPGDL